MAGHRSRTSSFSPDVTQVTTLQTVSSGSSSGKVGCFTSTNPGSKPQKQPRNDECAASDRFSQDWGCLYHSHRYLCQPDQRQLSARAILCKALQSLSLAKGLLDVICEAPTCLRGAILVLARPSLWISSLFACVRASTLDESFKGSILLVEVARYVHKRTHKTFEILFLV